LQQRIDQVQFNPMSDGFLGRWSRRKVEVREGKTVEPQAPPVSEPAPLAPSSTEAALAPAPTPTEPAPPTLDDALQLNLESDFKPFMARNVAPEVKNAAMKKLFTDPHFNVMDMMDVYVDDYSKSDPIPQSMLRQMASAKFLKLFDDDEEQAKNNPTRDDADATEPQNVAQLSPDAPATPTEAASPPSNDNPDMRLQPDDAPERQSAGRRSE
jgi:Protein of unknown function (DUF3306)